MTSKVGFKGPLGLSVALFVLAGDPMSGAAQETLRDNRTAGRVEVQEVTTLRFHRVAVAPVLQTQVFRLPGGGWGTTSRVFGGILALFSATGSPTGTLGRHGPGPGEFENPAFAIAVGKQLWVVDPGNNRLTAFASDGTVIGDRLLPGSVFWVQPAADDSGVLLSGYFRRPSRTSNTVVWVTMDEREDRFGGDIGTSTNPWVQQDLAAATPFGEIWAVARAGGEVDILRAHNMERLASIQLPEDESQPGGPAEDG